MEQVSDFTKLLIQVNQELGQGVTRARFNLLKDKLVSLDWTVEEYIDTSVDLRLVLKEKTGDILYRNNPKPPQGSPSEIEFDEYTW